jgi:fucose permease
MRKLWDRLRPESDREATLILGLTMLAVGLALWWPPAALIVPGAVLTLVGILSRPSGEVTP